MENKARIVNSWKCDVDWGFLPCGCDLEEYTNHVLEEESFYGPYQYEYGECDACGAVFYELGYDLSPGEWLDER